MMYDSNEKKNMEYPVAIQAHKNIISLIGYVRMSENSVKVRMVITAPILENQHQNQN